MRKTLIAALLVSGVVAAAALAAGSARTGPSSSTAPYVLPSQDGGKTVSILTVGDSVDGYRLVGIPDGLGAYESRPGTFTIFANHEIAQTLGTVRDHGATGAFVSNWVVRKKGLSVAAGRDHIVRVATWNAATSAYNHRRRGS